MPKTKAIPVDSFDRFSDIEEVVQVGRSKANFYLASGYRLLQIQTDTQLRHEGEKMPWVHRMTRFVIGRPRGVEAVTAPDYVPPKAEPQP